MGVIEISGDMMEFPETVEEFMDDYKVVDSEGIYMSKGAELVPIFRMNQWFDHEMAKKLEDPGQYAYDYGYQYGYEQGWTAAVETFISCLESTLEEYKSMI